MNKNYTILFLLACFFSFSNALWSQVPIEEQSEEQIEWITIEEALEKCIEEPKKILVEVFIEDDNWCKMMNSVTYQKKHIIKYINENFYAVKFNAESKKDIEFKSKEYDGASKNGYHALALYFSGDMVFPSIAFLDEDQKVIQTVSGFIDGSIFEMIITFFGRNAHETTPWKKYQEEYIPFRLWDKQEQEELEKEKKKITDDDGND